MQSMLQSLYFFIKDWEGAYWYGKEKEFQSQTGKEYSKKTGFLYVMMLPVVLYYIIFAYAPMYGVQLAFKNYKIKLGIMGSPWVGLDHFKTFFQQL